MIFPLNLDFLIKEGFSKFQKQQWPLFLLCPPQNLDLIFHMAADMNECKIPGICKGVCHNTIGSYDCTECPYKTQYDTITMKCISTRKQNLLVGELYMPVN